jgi:hypothetical protein
MGTHLQFKNADVHPHPVLPYITWGGRILTLHFDYVAGYTDPLILFFELTQLTPDEMTHLAFGNPPPPVLEKVLKGLQKPPQSMVSLHMPSAYKLRSHVLA